MKSQVTTSKSKVSMNRIKLSQQTSEADFSINDRQELIEDEIYADQEAIADDTYSVMLTYDELDLLRGNMLKVCKICNAVKPPRTHHCSQCDRCVVRMDHHCPWVGNCVGLRNYKPFLLFSFYVSIVALITVIYLIVIAVVEEADLNEEKMFLIIITIVLALIFGTFTFSILQDQLSMISKGTSTIDLKQSKAVCP